MSPWLLRTGRCVVFVCVLALLAVAGGAARARSLDAAGTAIVDFADTHQAPVAASVPFELTRLRQLYCSGRGDRGGPLSLDGALGVARSLVAADSRGRGLSAFARSRAGRREATAIAAAAGALGVGKPAAALAALLRAHQLAPRDATPLVDAAPLLSQAGRGRAAVALLDAARRLKPAKSSPFGIGWAAISAANRGQALIAMHQYGKAEAALAAALKAAPLLREAEQNMAVAYDCQKNSAKATRFLIAAVRRQTFAATDYTGATGDPFAPLNPAIVLDTSKGATLTLQTLNYPATWQEGMTQLAAWLALDSDLTTKSAAGVQQYSNDRAGLTTQLAAANPLTRQRTEDILAAVETAGSEPDLALLSHQIEPFASQIVGFQGSGSGQNGCINPNLHDAWLAAVEGYDHTMRSYAVALYRRQTGLAANLKNPLAHQVAMELASNQALSNLTLMVGHGHGLAIYDRVCHIGQKGSASQPPASGENETPASEPCPSGLTAPDFSLDLVVLSFSANCEEVTAGAAVGEGWLNVFVDVSHNFKTGSNTIFGGPQLGHTFKLGPLGAGATARGGLSATFGADGTMQSIGLRADSSISLSVGPAIASIAGPSASLSFAGAFTSPM